MRLNKFIAQATGLSRRAADAAIEQGRVLVDNADPTMGQDITDANTVMLDGKTVRAHAQTQTIMLNKPVGYICSRDGQGGQTIYDILPPELHHLKPVGRLDKNSSGLLLLTNDGELAHKLTHPSFEKTKVYKIALNRPLSSAHRHQIVTEGVTLEDGVSKLQLDRLGETDDSNWRVTMFEGRNRQIRRTFEALGYNVVKLHRTHFGDYQLENLKIGTFKDLA